MSGILWSRRPSAPDTTASGSGHISPRPRTTSGGGLAAFTNVLGLNKAKSRERLRNTGTTSLPAKPSANRQTVVSTESGSSDMWPNEPTTPSSASDTKQSFQGMGMGVGDDPFARPPVYVSKDKPESPVPSLAAFPDPPARRPRTATQRNNSTGPLLDPGPSRHLHPHASPKSSSSKLSLSSRSRSTSASSSVPPAKSPRTPPPVISAVSPADMHAHADAVSWSPESMYDPQIQIDIRPRQYDEQEDAPSIRRGQSAHAVLAPSSRLPPTPRLIHSASSSHLSSPSVSPSTPSPLLSPHAGRAGLSAASGMGSMTALASGIVKGLEDEPVRAPPKRPSRSELRNKTSTTSLIPPTRKASLNALRDSALDSSPAVNANGLSSVPESHASTRPGTTRPLEPFQSPPLQSPPTRSHGPLEPAHSPRSLDPAHSHRLEPPQSPETLIRVLESLELTPPANASPNAISPPRHRTTSSPARTGLRPAPTSPRLNPSSPRLNPSSPRLNPSSPRLNPSSPRLNPSSPRLNPASPRLGPTRRNPTSPRLRASEDSIQDLDNYDFTIAPAIQETDAQSISFSELGVQLGDDEDVWSDDGLTFHHGGTDSLHYVSAESSRYSRRPPPSPTSLPFMAGNARRRPRQDTVYPSGVHTIPMADQRALAQLGRDEFRVGKEEDAVVGQSHSELDASASIEEEHEFPTPPASSPSPVNPLERISSMSAGSQTSSCSSIAPDAIPPQTVSSHLTFSKHARTASYSDSEIDFELPLRSSLVSKPNKHLHSTQTAVAWRCGAGNHEKCCGTRAIAEGVNNGQFKCCAERTSSGKNARCCASFVGRPCERPRVSSTSSASVSELKRQRSYHFASLPGIPAHAPAGGKRAKGFFHRPHTSHGKSTSSALLDEETRAIIQSKTREDPGPQSPTSDVFASAPAAPCMVASPPTSPVSRHEFQAKPIISRAKLHDHLKEALAAPSPSPSPDPVKSPKLEPTRARSNTTTTDTSGSVRSAFSNPSGDAPALMRPLPMRPRRIQNVSLPVMTTSQPVQQPRRFVQSITSVVQPAGLTRPPPPSAGFSSAASIASSSGISSIHSSSGFAGSGLPPPRRHATGRMNTQPIVSFISSHSAPTPHTAPQVNPAGLLRHRSSRESYESTRTVRRERSIPLRENQMSFLEFGVEEEGSEEEEEIEQQSQPYPSRPTLQHTQSFLDLSGRQSGDTMRENVAMFS